MSSIIEKKNQNKIKNDIIAVDNVYRQIPIDNNNNINDFIDRDNKDTVINALLEHAKLLEKKNKQLQSLLQSQHTDSRLYPIRNTERSNTEDDDDLYAIDDDYLYSARREKIDDMYGTPKEKDGKVPNDVKPFIGGTVKKISTSKKKASKKSQKKSI